MVLPKKEDHKKRQAAVNSVAPDGVVPSATSSLPEVARDDTIESLRPRSAHQDEKLPEPKLSRGAGSGIFHLITGLEHVMHSSSSGTNDGTATTATTDSTKVEAKGPKPGMFVDAAAMKAKLREDILKPQYNVADLYHDEGIAQAIAKNGNFEYLTLAVIGFNAVWIGIDTDHNKSEVLLKADPIFQVAENMFCIYFTFEVCVRFCAFMQKCDALRDPWFVFDSLLVASMVLETWVMTAIIAMTNMGGTGPMGNASILRILRLLRLTRMGRILRLLRNVPELLILIKGMTAAFRSVSITLMLLCVVNYVFAILFTQLMEDSDLGDEHFKTVAGSMHTLVVYGTFLDDLASLVFVIEKANWLWLCLFYCFVLLSALTVMNMLIGVLCEVVSAVAAVEKEELNLIYFKSKLEAILADAETGVDLDGDKCVSKSEFIGILEIPQASQALREVDVDPVALVDLADFIFEDVDKEPDEDMRETKLGRDADEGRKLTFTDFIEMLMQLRGSNTATVKDIVDMRRFIHRECQSTHMHLWKLEERLNEGLRRSGLSGSDKSQHASSNIRAPAWGGSDHKKPSESIVVHSQGDLQRAQEQGEQPMKASTAPVHCVNDQPQVLRSFSEGQNRYRTDHHDIMVEEFDGPYESAVASGGIAGDRRQQHLSPHRKSRSPSPRPDADSSRISEERGRESDRRLQQLVPSRDCGSIPPKPDLMVITAFTDDLLLERTKWLEQVLTTGHEELQKYIRYMTQKRDAHSSRQHERNAVNPEVVLPGSLDSPRGNKGSRSRQNPMEPLEFASMKALEDALSAGLMALHQVQTRAREANLDGGA